MTTMSRWTGFDKLVSLSRYFAFNGPRLTTASGVVLLGGIAAVRLYLLLTGPVRPAYLAAYFAVLITGAVVASTGMATGSRPGLVTFGWWTGSLLSAASFAMYVVSRTVGLPGLSQLVGRWNEPLGTLSMVLAVLFLALHFSVLIGMNIAVPQRRRWHS